MFLSNLFISELYLSLVFKSRSLGSLGNLVKTILKWQKNSLTVNIFPKASIYCLVSPVNLSPNRKTKII